MQFYPKGCTFVNILGCYNPGGKAVLLTAKAIQHPALCTWHSPKNYAVQSVSVLRLRSPDLKWP